MTERMFNAIAGALIGIAGFVWLIDLTSWKDALAIAIILWGNNIGQNT